MLYTLLGRLVWTGAKLFLRRKYGPARVPKPLVAGGLAAVLAGVLAAVLLLRGRRDSAAA
jgi:hypothetical protein